MDGFSVLRYGESFLFDFSRCYWELIKYVLVYLCDSRAEAEIGDRRGYHVKCRHIFAIVEKR